MTQPITPNIAIISTDEFTAATTRVVGRRTFTQPIELPSGVLTGDPNRSSDGLRVAMCYPWSDEDREAMHEMFLSLEWASELPDGWGAEAEALAG